MEELIPFKKRTKNFVDEDSFLYSFRTEKIYVFDNHRLSLWCWRNFIKKYEYGKKYNLIYIDKHIDCCCSSFDDRYKTFLEKEHLFKKLDNFRTILYTDDEGTKKSSVMNYGNFLAFALKLELFKNIFIFTQFGDIETYFKREIKYNTKEVFNLDNITCVNRNVERNLVKTFGDHSSIILDIDLDFFTKNVKGKYFIDVISLKRCLKIIKDNLNKIEFITIALSPNCCGGWRNSEKILAYFKLVFNLDLELPLQTAPAIIA